MPIIAQVALSGATADYDKLYSYAVPALMEGHIFVGSMVLVPFGRGARVPRVGVVIERDEMDEETFAQKKGLKAIYDAAPPEARLTDELVAVVRYLKEATFCTWYEAVRAVLPHGAQYKAQKGPDGWVLQAQIRRHTEPVYELAGDAPDEGAKKPTTKQRQVLDALEDGPLTRAALMERCGVGAGVLATLCRNGWLTQDEQDKEVELSDFFVEEDGGRQGGKAADSAGESLPAGPTLSEAQQAVADALLAEAAQPQPVPALLHGVTGSGKTAVFTYLVHRMLQSGKTALVLVPEIGLTPQMITKMRESFGPLVAVQHSGLSHTERLLQWRAIRRGQARVVVGTRSAVFAPLEDIGVIVVDEEQERSYQSESAPRYDAVEVAKRRAARHGALLLLASATPSVASYFQARSGRYTLHTLTERWAGAPLPAVELVDMHEELMEGNPRLISRQLAEATREALDAGQQAIYLLNRRGYHRVGMCRTCGEVLKCPDCSVPMVYHRGRPIAQAGGGRHIPNDGAEDAPEAHLPGSSAGNSEAFAPDEEPAETYNPAVEEQSPAPAQDGLDVMALWKQLAARAQSETPPPAAKREEAGGRLLCHYCGRSQPAPAVCPACGGEMRYTGFGTQRLEEELAALFPAARVLRMDMDSTSRRGAHAGMLRAFGKGEYDILLGTQMVAKGLDFERVGLVGVIGIDSLLFAQGYRALEQVFSLVTQVVGRSGRSGSEGAQGKALIQSFDPENPVLTLAAAQDYEAFYEQEIEFRRLSLYPPLCGLCVAVFTAAGEEQDAIEAATAFSALLVKRAAENPAIPLRVLGPAPMAVARVAGSWRWRLTLKCRADAAFRALLAQTTDDWRRAGWPKRAGLVFDFNSDGN